jgi:hypothetical protein
MSEKKLRPRQIPAYWGMWIASSLLSVADWWVLRVATTGLSAAIAELVPIEVQVERQWYLRWVTAATAPFAWVCFGIIAVLSIIGFEALYRDGLIKGKARKRFTVVTSIQGGLLLLSLLTVAILSRVVT